MKRIIFGGAFDPIHIDHMNKSKQVLDITKYDRLILMPTYEHIWGKETAHSMHRISMIIDSIRDVGDDRIWIDAFEIIHRISGPTIDTLKMLFEPYSVYSPDNTVYLIGMDQALVMHTWERWEELIDLIPFIVMSRGEDMGEDLLEECGVDWFLHPPHKYVKTIGTDISSSKIRHDIKSNTLDPKYLTPSTLDYIQEHGLYV